MRELAATVVHVIAPAPFGGAETVVAALAAGAQRSGRRVHVAVLDDGVSAAPFTDRLRAARVPFTAVPLGRRTYWRESGAVAHLARVRAPSLLHTHVQRADLVGWLAAMRAGVPVVATVHGLTGGPWRNALNEWVDMRLLRRFDAVVCVSDSVAHKVRGAGVRPERIHRVVNGIPPEEPLPRALARVELGEMPDGPLLGWVGRFVPEKGPDVFVELFTLMARHDARGVLVGDGPSRAIIEARIREAGLADRVRCTGPRPNARRLLRAFDALVVSSRTEGSPMVVLEAMTAGVPVVAFGVGGVPHLLDGDAGVVVTPGDVAGLADACRQVLDDPTAAAARAARAAGSAAQRFGMTRWLEESDLVYRTVLEGRGAHAA